jgi:hypothetical protein
MRARSSGVMVRLSTTIRPRIASVISVSSQL